MMSNCTTFGLPQVKDVIPRHRLYKQLDSGMDKPVILIQGQAAQGKSTLVASYLSRYDSLCDSSESNKNSFASAESPLAKDRCLYFVTAPVWLHLSHRESDHTSLFALLVNALSQKHIVTASPVILGTVEDISRQVDIVLSILDSIAKPLTIVFDNLESIDKNGSAYLLIQSIVNHISSKKFRETSLGIEDCSDLTVDTPTVARFKTGVRIIQLFLISREIPPIDLSQLKIEHGFLAIKNEELAFTLEETGEFLQSHCNGRISPDLERDIHTITEGWPGGVALICESISRSSDMEALSFPGNIKDAKSIHITAQTLDYFSNEVYALLPGAIKHFLIRASLFDEIDEQMATHLCDTPNGDEILIYLEKRSLFIQRMSGISPPMAGALLYQADKPAPAYYRFNTLFRQFLFKALIREISSDELKALNGRAARFFEKRGEIELSVRYYLEAEDYSMASDMIKKCATDLVVRGYFPKIGGWIEALPEPVVKNDPWLIYYLTVTRRIRGGTRNVDDFLAAIKLFEARNDTRGTMLATAHLIEAGVFVRKSPAKIAEWIKKGESLLLHVTDTPYFNWARALLWQQIAFGYIAGEVDIHKGFSSCKNARILAKRIGNHEIELNASIVMAFGYVRICNFSGAERLLKEIQPLTNEDIHPEYRTLKHIIRIDCALRQGSFEEAAQYLQESEKDVERFGLIFLYPEFIELKAMHRIYTGRFREATTIADHLSDFSILSGNTFYLALAHHIKAIIHYHSGSLQNDIKPFQNHGKSIKHLDRAASWLGTNTLFQEAQSESEQSLCLLNQQKGEDSRLFAAKALDGLIMMRLGRYQDAEKSLVQAFEYFEHVSSGVSWCETKAALGLLFWRCSQQEEVQAVEKHVVSPSNNATSGNNADGSNTLTAANAREYILQSLTRAFQEGYERFSLMSPSDFSEIVLLGISFDDSNTLFNALSPMISNQSKLYNISSKFNITKDQDGYKKNRVPKVNTDVQIVRLLNNPLLMGDINALNRLRHLYRLTLPKVSITTFGKFSVFINNQQIEDNTWEGNKPKLLLKSIICHGTRDVSKEMINDDIWPDASIKAGEKNFKINLHRLRKALEPDVKKQVGYSYITMDAGRLSLDPELVTVDIDTFTNLARQGYEKLSRDEVALAISFFEQAVTIYKGDFLAEESYEAWIDLKRESLRTYYMEILMTMARVYEEQEQPFQAMEYLKKAIQADHLYEEAYQNLMIVYADAGMVKAATGLYERWRQVAQNELGVEPAPETRNIYNKIEALNFRHNQMTQFKKR